MTCIAPSWWVSGGVGDSVGRCPVRVIVVVCRLPTLVVVVDNNRPAVWETGLVQYMRSLRQTVTRAILQSLRMSGRVDPLADASAVPLAPAASPPMDDQELDSVIAILALTRCLHTETVYLNGVLRMFVAALHAIGHGGQAGWTIRFQQYRRRAPLSQEAYEEECMRWVRANAERSPLNLAARVRELRETFGRTTNRLLLVCVETPGPRYGWPGLKRVAKRGRSGQQQLDGNIRNLLFLRRITDPLVRRFHAHHPLLKTIVGGSIHGPWMEPRINRTIPDIQRVFREVVDRLCRVARDINRLWGDPAVVPDAARRLSAERTLSEICRLTPPSPPVAVIPLALLVGLGQVADDLRFLRQFFSHCRRLMEEGLRVRNTTEWVVDCHLPANIPNVRCRLRPLVRLDWMHILQTNWPQKFLEFRAAPPPKPPLHIHTLICSFAGVPPPSSNDDANP